MSAVQLIAALLLLIAGGALLFRWLQNRHDDEWKDGVGETRDANAKHSQRGKPRDGRDISDLGSDSGADSDDGTAGGRGNAGGRVNRHGAARGAGGGLRRRGARGAHDAQQQQQPDNDDAAGVDDEYDENGVKLTRLQKKKLAKEREKEERRQAQEAALDGLRQRADASTLREAEAALKEEELKRAEEIALRELRAEKEAAANEEYAKWVGHMGVEERGELGDEARERQAKVQAFLMERAAAVQARALRAPSTAPFDTAAAAAQGNGEEKKDGSEGNVLVLQSAARDLRVSVEELANTIEQMTRDGLVDGVFDDRGKFVFIAPEHFPQLAQFIRLRGRVSVQELTRECNRVVMQS